MFSWCKTLGDAKQIATQWRKNWGTAHWSSILTKPSTLIQNQSCFDYCNFLLSGIPQQLIDKLQKVQNCSARLIFKSSKCTHVSPLLTKLHWLPIAQRIDYKISSLCYDVASDTAPLYLSDLLRLYVPSRSLRSSADTRIFRIPRRKKKFQGQRAFSHLDPDTWNKLPYSVGHAQTQSQFKTQLKTTPLRSV